MIQVNLGKAKTLAHNLRRFKRDAAFVPLDILATVPHLAVKAEEDRAILRASDDNLQLSIEATATVDALTALLPVIDEGVILI